MFSPTIITQAYIKYDFTTITNILVYYHFSWRASKASETLSGVTNVIGDIYIWYVRPPFSSAFPGLHNVGGVKCQPFLKHSNHWKRALKMIFKGSGCFQFAEAVTTSTVKESLRSSERGSLQVLAVL